MRVFEPTVVALAGFLILAAAGPAAGAWRAEENGPHPQIAKQEGASPSAEMGTRASGGVAPVHATTCKRWRPSTIKPFIKKCIE